MLNYNTPNGLLAAKAKGGVRLIFSWNAFNKIKHSTGDVNKNQRATKHVLYIYIYILDIALGVFVLSSRPSDFSILFLQSNFNQRFSYFMKVPNNYFTQY